MTRLARHDLTLGAALGSGAQGKVYPVARAHGFTAPFALVYKEFSRGADVKGVALDTMVALRHGLEPRDREFLDRHTTWPLIVVEDRGRVAGYLMQAVPEQYFQAFRLSTGTKKKPREIQQLFQSDELAKRNLGIVPTWRERFRIARVTANVLDFLHRHELVFGDISYKNEVWSVRSAASMMFVDCDGVRRMGQGSAVPQAHSPGWEPPERHAVQTIQTDRYKLGLLVLRCVSPGANAQNRDPSTADPHLDAEGRALLRRSLGTDPAARPSGADWVAYLDRAISRLPAEPVRSSAPPPPPAPPPPMVPGHGMTVGRRLRPAFTSRARARTATAAGPPRRVYANPAASWRSPTPSRFGFGHPPTSLQQPPAGSALRRTGPPSARSVMVVIALCMVGLAFALFGGLTGKTTSSTSTSVVLAGARTELFRYFKAGSAADGTSDDHGTHPRQVIAGFTQERALGSVLSVPAAGTTAIYECISGTDSYTSPDTRCQGAGPGQFLGYVLDYPRAGVSTAPLYRCLAGGDHFDSTDVACEGQQKDLLLGYVILG